jgi:hypothetical protein
MADTDEHQFWALQSRNGDRAVFDASIRKHQPRIRPLAVRRTGSLMDCKDLAKGTFVSSFHQLGSANAPSIFHHVLSSPVSASPDWQRQDQRGERLHQARRGGGIVLEGNPFSGSKAGQIGLVAGLKTEAKNLRPKVLCCDKKRFSS